MTPILDQIDGITVVRDDHVPGGTKRAVLDTLLSTHWPAPLLVYAGPAQGYAQVAIAIAGTAAGRDVAIFVPARKHRSVESHMAATHGAAIHEVTPGYMTVLRKRAREYAAANDGHLLPLGLDTPAFVRGIAVRAQATGLTPTHVVAAAGTGTLVRGLQLAWPTATITAVQIGMAPNAGRATVVSVPEAFHQPAREPPPFPSATHYDAKAWRYATPTGHHGPPPWRRVVFWNVAGDVHLHTALP